MTPRSRIIGGHDNRHTFCSRLVQAGVHLKVVQEAAGHASIASTMRYAHFAPSQVVDAMAVLNSKGREHSITRNKDEQWGYKRDTLRRSATHS